MQTTLFFKQMSGEMATTRKSCFDCFPWLSSYAVLSVFFINAIFLSKNAVFFYLILNSILLFNHFCTFEAFIYWFSNLIII
jgi:hypothetical protein